MFKSLCILGRQPALGLAELESLYGPEKILAVDSQAALVDVDPCLLAFDRLGGSVKFCKLLTILDTTNWRRIEKFLIEVSPGHSERMAAGKMYLGLSAIGLQVTPKQLEATALALKKAIRVTGRPVRVVPNKGIELNTAQVLHNKLTGPNGWELIFIRDGQKTVVAQTVKVQDIEAYGARDQKRPKRDPRVGMLPPKLAQIIINLAVGLLPDEARQSVCEIPPDEPIPRKHFNKTVLDPFCGTGVILQEALLMGYEAYGTDIERRMFEYSQANLEWLCTVFDLPSTNFRVSIGDATQNEWVQPIDFVACEAYLGRPFSAPPKPETLNEVMNDVNTILTKFLKNLYVQLKPDTRLCLGVPAWKVQNSFKHLKMLDSLEELGYNRLSFAHVRNDQLLYYRPDQIVARELVVLVRK
jgi:tRNA (guanine10-N2)-dimethyltransferase